jgi:hypothetical protein
MNPGLTAAILQDEEDLVVPDEAKAIFHAEVELAVWYLPLERQTSLNLWS